MQFLHYVLVTFGLELILRRLQNNQLLLQRRVLIREPRHLVNGDDVRFLRAGSEYV